MSLFFLTSTQEKVLRSISEEPLSVTDIAESTKLPRTSVAKALEKLESLNLVKGRKVRDKNKHLFYRVSFEEIDQAITHFRNELYDGRGVSSVSFVTTNPVQLFSGKEAILKALHAMITSRKNQKVYVVQGKDAADAWMSYIGHEEVLAIHQKIVEFGLIVVSVRGSGLKEIIEFHEPLKKSYTGRVTRAHAIPDHFFQEKMSVYAFKSSLLYVNLKQEQATLITDQGITQSYIKMLNYVLDESKREI